jgi:acyl-coenzyme A synthetase/AMP-(fatty) acid ligase
MHFGFTTALLPLCLGKTTFFAQTYEEAIRLIDIYRIDYAVGSPAQFVGLLDGYATAPLPTSSLKFLLSGGGPLVPQLIANVQNKLGAQFFDVYSSTEGGPAGIAQGQFLLERTNDLSFIPNVPVRCVNPDGSPTESDGLIEVYSRSLAAQYVPCMSYVMPEQSWVKTGDVGRIEANGSLTILGRGNDIINAAGRKINARSIETVLMNLPGIEDAGVIIADQESYANEIWIALVCSEVPDLLAVAKAIATGFNGLQADRIVRFPKLPRSSLGKLQSAELQKMIRSIPQSNGRG